MEVRKIIGTVEDNRAEENARANLAQMAANLDYVAMMADIEIPTEEGDDDGQVRAEG